MPLDPARVRATFDFDAETLAGLRRDWLALLDLSVFGEVKSSKIGAVDRLRRRLLEIGEGLRSLINDRSWIPQPREQIKGAMGASVKLRDALLGLERAAQAVDGGADFARFERELLDFRQRLLMLIEKHENAWAALLEALYDENEEEE